jgi:carboxyl-terminal processing protease
MTMPVNGEPGKLRRIASGYLAVVFVISAFLWGYHLGTNRSQAASAVDSASSTIEIVGTGESRRIEKLDFRQFWELWDTIKEQYVRQPVDEKKMFYGAMAGIVASLGDAHSVFLDPKVNEEFQQELAGKFSGIGAEIGIKNDKLLVIAPLPDSPAEKSGLQPGDHILGINDEDTFGMSIDAAVSKIRGDKGTTVKLHVIHKGSDKPKIHEIVRDIIVVHSVKLKWAKSPKGKKVAHIVVSSFNDDTVDRFTDAVTEAEAKGAEAVILDLRSNPGGYLNAAIAMLGEWVPGEVAVMERYSDGSTETDRAHGLGRFKTMPTVVMVNEGSASASEIMAGALHDHGKAVLIGALTFGKGSVQDLIPFKDGSSVKLTIAEWLTPDGRNIDRDGIEPDYYVNKTPEDYDQDRDPPLDAARAFFDGVIPKQDASATSTKEIK